MALSSAIWIMNAAPAVLAASSLVSGRDLGGDQDGVQLGMLDCNDGKSVWWEVGFNFRIGRNKGDVMK